MKYKIKNIDKNTVEEWTASQMLNEINRERSDEWTPYSETDDVVAAWTAWVEEEGFYSLVKE